MKDNGGHAQKHKITRLEAELTNLRSEVKGYKESEESCMQQISNLKREKNEGKKREI